MTAVPKFKRVAAGHYETADARFMLFQLCDVYPPAWNVEDIGTAAYEGEVLIVDGAATKRDALAIFAEWFEGFACRATCA